MTWKSVFDPEFKYRRAEATDVRLTFARIRRERRQAQSSQGGASVSVKVVPIGGAPERAWPFTDGRDRAAG